MIVQDYLWCLTMKFSREWNQIQNQSDQAYTESSGSNFLTPGDNRILLLPLTWKMEKSQPCCVGGQPVIIKVKLQLFMHPGESSV